MWWRLVAAIATVILRIKVVVDGEIVAIVVIMPTDIVVATDVAIAAGIV